MSLIIYAEKTDTSNHLALNDVAQTWLDHSFLAESDNDSNHSDQDSAKLVSGSCDQEGVEGHDCAQHAHSAPTSSLLHKVERTIDVALLEKEMASLVEERHRTYRVEGFRKGKVPLALIEERLRSACFGQAVENLVKKDVAEYLKAHSYKLARQAEYTLINAQDHQPITYTLRFEVLPEINPAACSLDDLRVAQYVVSLEKDDIEKFTQDMVAQHMSDKETQEGAKLGLKVRCTMRIETVRQHQEFLLEFIVGQQRYGQEIDQLVEGKTAGAVIEKTMRLHKKFVIKEFAGKNVKVIIRIHEVLERVPSTLETPNIFAYFQCGSLEELHHKAHELIHQEIKRASKLLESKILVDQILERTGPFDVPQDVLQRERYESWKHILEQLQVPEIWQLTKEAREAIFQEHFQKNEEEVLHMIDAVALRRARLRFVFDWMRKTHVSEEALAKTLIQDRPLEEQKALMDLHRQNPQRFARLQEAMIENYMNEFLLSKAERFEEPISYKNLLDKIQSEVSVL